MATVLAGGIALDMHNANVGSILTGADSVERNSGAWSFIKGSGLATEAIDSFLGQNFIYDDMNMLVAGTVERWVHDIYIPGGGVMGWTIDGGSAPGHPLSIALMGNDANMLFELFLPDDDTITGSEFSDVLDGYRGNDQISGGRGNDLVIGDFGNDKLYGNAGNDTISGSDGKDRLIGGPGADTFVFDVALRSGNADKVLDFNPADDIFHLESKYFRGLAEGVIAENIFTTGAAATETTHRIVYDDTTGRIYFDRDGTGPLGLKLFATVTPGTDLQFTDFFVI